MPLPAHLTRPIEVLMIDNFDSFTWNLYQSLCLLGTDVIVIRNDAISPQDFSDLQIRSLVISPGPGHPQTDAGISQAAITYFMGKVPILGVCMGSECPADVLGGEIAYVCFSFPLSLPDVFLTGFTIVTPERLCMERSPECVMITEVASRTFLRESSRSATTPSALSPTSSPRTSLLPLPPRRATS